MAACATSRKRLLCSNVLVAQYVSKKFFPQRSSWDEIWNIRGARETHPTSGCTDIHLGVAGLAGATPAVAAIAGA
jgi:hypothetical protein